MMSSSRFNFQKPLRGVRPRAMRLRIAMAIPPWDEQQSAEFQRTVMWLAVALSTSESPTAAVMLMSDGYIVAGTDVIVEVRDQGVEMLRAGKREGCWNDPQEMFLDRIQGRNMSPLGPDVRLSMMLVVREDELRSAALSAREKPSTWADCQRLWKNVEETPTCRRLPFVRDYRNHLGGFLKPKEGETGFPVRPLDHDIQQVQGMFSGG